MLLAPSGMDVFYVDESERKGIYVLTSVTVPLLRMEDGVGWRIVWNDCYEKYKAFKKHLRSTHGVPVTKELHARKLASGRGRYGPKGTQFGKTAGSAVYRWILSRLDQVLPERSIITVTGNNASLLYGSTGLDACLHALFQRMQRACEKEKTNGMTFFDEGHGEYLTAYRKARVYLPTGSKLSAWPTGAATQNKPMVNFFKDANFKDSAHSLFVQIADLVAYAASMLRAKEEGTLTAWQQKAELGDAYDDIPQGVLNRKAATLDARGIVRL